MEGGRRDMVDVTLRLLMCALIEAPDYSESPTFANAFVGLMLQVSYTRTLRPHTLVAYTDSDCRRVSVGKVMAVHTSSA